MRTKEEKKTKAKAGKADTIVPVKVDPFAEMVESPKSEKTTIKAVKAKAVEVRKPVKRAAKKAVEPLADAAADAFSEIVAEAAEVKKPAAKSAKAKARKATASKPELPASPVVLSTTPKKESVRKTAAAGSPVKGKTVKTPAKKANRAEVPTLDVTADVAVAEPEVEVSPVFKALADVSLPELKKENRARLLMQSPTRLYFYWSVRENPWQRLRNIFGDDLGSYTLVLKLTDLKRDGEQIHPCEADGNWWFDVEPDSEYQAEIGFYAVNRPYFRIIYSNTITTPRRSPSPRPASEARWTVSATKFAEVLDVAGFSRDAVDVAMAGDDHAAAGDAAHSAFASLIGTSDGVETISPEDIRYAMLALASGFTLEELRFRVGPALFAILQANVEKLASEKALSALMQHFDVDEVDWTEEEFSSAVYGASLVHFPKTLKTKKIASKKHPAYAPRYNPVSSHSLR